MIPFFFPRRSLRPLPVSYSGIALVVDSECEEAVGPLEYMLPPLVNCLAFNFLHVHPTIVLHLVSVEAETIVYLPATSSLPERACSRLIITVPGTVAHLYGVGRLWYATANIPLELEL